MHCDTLKQDSDCTVRGDGGSRVGEVRAGTTSPMPEHKGFKLQWLSRDPLTPADGPGSVSVNHTQIMNRSNVRSSPSNWSREEGWKGGEKCLLPIITHINPCRKLKLPCTVTNLTAHFIAVFLVWWVAILRKYDVMTPNVLSETMCCSATSISDPSSP